MKRNFSSIFHKRGKRRGVGQTVAVLVMALAITVGSAGTTALLVTQPTGLTVEPSAQQQSWEHGSSKPADRGGHAQQQPEPSAEPVPEESSAPEAPAQSAPIETQSAPAEAEPVSEPAAESGPAQPEPFVPEMPALPAPGDLEEENSLYHHLFQEETPELAAEDPLSPPQDAAAEENGLGSWPGEENSVTLTPEQIQAALDAGTLTEAESYCLDMDLDMENCLRWLWEWLFGKPEPPKYSGWHTEDDKTYYYSETTNEALTGIQSIDGKLYYFDESGVMQQDVTFGIDVSKYQQDLDWDAIKQTGVEFVIVRIGYRGYGSGTLVLDPMFEQHFTNARNAGLRVGVYMFSQAINEDEAREEAFACAYVLNGRALDYPIYFDSEASGSPDGTGRADGLGTQERTACAVAFCEEVRANGYQPGVYASTAWFQKRLDLNALMGYSIWNAHYGVPRSGIACDLWQGSCTARLNGYNGPLDVNISYIG